MNGTSDGPTHLHLQLLRMLHVCLSLLFALGPLQITCCHGETGTLGFSAAEHLARLPAILLNRPHPSSTDSMVSVKHIVQWVSIHLTEWVEGASRNMRGTS